MSGKYEKYIIRKPELTSLPFGGRDENGNEVGEGEAKGKSGSNIYMSKKQVSASNLHMNLIWVYEIPYPNPYVINHSHPYDEYLFFIGIDPENPEELYGEVEFGIGGETYTFDTTTAIYLPANLEHCPVTYKRVDRPHVFVALSEGGDYGGEELA